MKPDFYPNLVIVGINVAFSQTFCLLMARLLSQHNGVRCEIIETTDISTFVKTVLRRGTEPFILQANRPDARLTEAIKDSGVRTIVLHEHLAFEVCLLQDQNKQPYSESLRVVQNFAVCYSRLRANERSYTMSPSQFLAEPQLELIKLCDALGICIDESRIEDFITEYDWPQISHPKEIVPSDIQSAIHGYDELARGIRAAVLICTKELMFLGPGTSFINGKEIDLTGKGGMLLFGPYASLSPGSWEAEICFAVSPEAIEASFRFISTSTFDGVTKETGLTDYTAYRSGKQLTSVIFQVDSIDQKIEITMHKTSHIPVGSFVFGYIRFTEIQDDSDQENWAKGIEPPSMNH